MLGLRAPQPAPPEQTHREGENLDFPRAASVPPPAPVPGLWPAQRLLPEPHRPQTSATPPFPHPQVERRKSFALKTAASLLFSLK